MLPSEIVISSHCGCCEKEISHTKYILLCLPNIPDQKNEEEIYLPIKENINENDLCIECSIAAAEMEFFDSISGLERKEDENVF